MPFKVPGSDISYCISVDITFYFFYLPFSTPWDDWPALIDCVCLINNTVTSFHLQDQSCTFPVVFLCTVVSWVDHQNGGSGAVCFYQSFLICIYLDICVLCRSEVSVLYICFVTQWTFTAKLMFEAFFRVGSYALSWIFLFEPRCYHSHTQSQ